MTVRIFAPGLPEWDGEDMTDRHLTKDEQKAMHRALRRSTKPVDLRAKSDALLKRCGWRRYKDVDPEDGLWVWAWEAPTKKQTWDALVNRTPHPHANAQDAVNLAEAMGLKITDIIASANRTKYKAILYRNEELFQCAWQATIAQAICAAIEEAITDMERLGSDFEKVYDDNAKELYEK